ncbi:MAG: ABC transporter substrate-binding protein [Candidatus Tectomicrobia bacterium]|uniref:ABC transporter substrate-binding protein n=1 Tax=Tectimicrobiota bacterium TaxID=2528274 RepID=A0A932GPL7_UNCTE|nr:ABC transporter substrate-binding protein [Candidatus Tectomicrobia bacterium]
MRRLVNSLFFLGLLALLLLPACSEDKKTAGENLSVSKPRPGGTFRRPLRNDPSTLDPAHITDVYGSTVAQQLHEGLIQFDQNLNVVPAIARSWTASRDGLTWTFGLRPGVRFHHGREVIAEDFVYSFRRILSPRTKSELTWLFDRIAGAPEYMTGKASQVKGLEALDRYTLRIRLSEPFAPFITLLGMAQAKVVPRELVEGKESFFASHPVGAGPFQFAGWERGKTILLEANENYYEGRPYLDRIEFRIYAGLQDERILADFEAGQLDAGYIPGEIAPQKLQEILNTKRYQHLRKPILSLLFWGMNTTRPPFNDLRVRQALNFAINVKAINDYARNGRFVPARGILPPGMPGFDPELRVYEHDLEKARSLLASVGATARAALPEIELWSNDNSLAARREYEVLLKNLEDLKIKGKIKLVPDWPTYEAALKRGDPLIYRYAWYADYPDPDNFLYVLLTPSSKYNFSRYRNGKITGLLSTARRETDYLKRVSLYRQAERQIMADAPWVPIFHHTFEYLLHSSVRGIEINALGERFIPMKKVWFAPGNREARPGS